MLGARIRRISFLINQMANVTIFLDQINILITNLITISNLETILKPVSFVSLKLRRNRNPCLKDFLIDIDLFQNRSAKPPYNHKTGPGNVLLAGHT